MKIAVLIKRLGSLASLLAALACLSQTGCITGATRAIPASRLPDIYKAEPKCEEVPVNLTLLRQESPREYLLGPGDLVGVFVPTVIPGTVPGAAQEVPILASAGQMTRQIYPPLGSANLPNLGVPILNGSDGMLSLPRVSPTNMNGKTLTEAADIVRQTYQDSGIIRQDSQ